MTWRLVAGILLVLVAGCGGGGQSTAPAATITLAVPDRADLPDETKPVHLAVGQTFAVQTRHGDGAGYWKQTAGGNNTVLAPDGPSTVTSSCPTDVMGCGSTSEQLYRAASNGTTTVEWSFVGLGPGLSDQPGQLTEPCQGFAGRQCPIGRVRIAATVG